MVNTVIFDIGNVLVDFRWQGLYEDLGFTGEKFEKIADATVRSQWWNEFDRGILTLEEIIGKFTENAPEYEQEIRSIFDNMDNLLRGRAYANEWIRELKERGCKVYILSNMSKPAHEVHIQMDGYTHMTLEVSFLLHQLILVILKIKFGMYILLLKIVIYIIIWVLTHQFI